MSHSITDFIGKFNGGFRPNRYLVTGKVGAGQNTGTFHIKSASLPGSSITTLQIPYRGRFFKLPGNRLYDTWTITVLDDNPIAPNSSKLWADFHAWSEQFNSHLSNKVQAGMETDFGTDTDVENDSEGMIDWTIQQLDLYGNATKTITLKNCWPTKVGAVVLSMDNNDELLTFPVTLTYQYITITGVS